MIRTENVIWKCAICLMILAAGIDPISARGQLGPFDVHHEGGLDPWPGHLAPPDSSQTGWSRALLSTYFNEGYFAARIDSVNWAERRVFLTRGPEQTLTGARVRVYGSRSDAGERDGPDSGYGDVVSGEMNNVIRGKAGVFDLSRDRLGSSDVMSAANVERILSQILGFASQSGFLGAQAEISTFEKLDGGWRVLIDLFTGQAYTVNEVRLEGDERTSLAFASRLVGIRPGTPAAGIDLTSSRQALAGQGLHSVVGEPRFVLTGDSTASLVIPALPLPSGSFDLSAGFLPSSGSSKNQFVGSGHIELLNAFGRGRILSARVDRFPGQSSGVEISFREPGLGNWPLSLEGGFEGYQQDSTFSSIGYSVALGLLMESNMEVALSVRREQSDPLQAGLAFSGTEQRISKSDGTYLGVRTAYSQLDNRANPRRGFALSARVETGTRNRSRKQLVGGDTLNVASSEQQKRLVLHARNYSALSDRFTLLLGMEGHFSFSDQPDESELVRLGGARSLRGYDENQFRGKSAGRGFVELRAYADARTYGYVFYDLGVVETVKTAQSESITDVLPGFGVGFAFGSAAGPISISYAMNTQDALSDGRVHLGLSFGL